MINLYAIGDSFTAGCGCRPNDEFYKAYPEEVGKIWPDLLGEYLKVNKVLNYGTPSASNLVIFWTLNKLLSSIKRNDIVVVGTTDPARMGFYAEYANYPLSISAAGLDNSYNDGTWSEIMTESQFNALKAFAGQNHMALEHKWEAHYKTLFENTLFTLNRLGVRTLLWDYAEWTEHSQIMNYTYSKEKHVHDRHWSWEGHTSFFNKIKDKFYD